MKVTVTYELTGDPLGTYISKSNRLYDFYNELSDPIRAGVDATNAKLQADGKRIRVSYIDFEVSA